MSEAEAIRVPARSEPVARRDGALAGVVTLGTRERPWRLHDSLSGNET